MADARLSDFLRLSGHSSFDEMYRWSVRDVAGFTELVIRFLGIQFDRPFEQVLDVSRGIEWPLWCRGGEMNIAHSCLRHAGLAVIAENESGEAVQLSYGDLREAVQSAAAALKAEGIERGDRVAIYLPMRAETVVVLLACAWIGAIAVPLFSGYGPAAISERLNQTGAKAIVTCAGFQHGGKTIQLIGIAQRAAERVIALPLKQDGQRVDPESVDPEHPLMILFSSGTTGEPKGIVHSHCSFPIKAAQDMALQMDVHAGDRISWITDLGWMMGPWLIYGGLILGATVVLREGAVDWPSPEALWQFTGRNHLDVLGVSPSLVRRLAEFGKPEARDLSSLRYFASSGEPWDPASWEWLHTQVRDEPVPIINYSGGTEISGGILANHPLAPMKPCGFAAACPGMAADIAEGGELVIRAPWIGQARGFWNAPDRYLETYWSRIPGVWVHGDWAARDEDGTWFILGRSDDTLKIAGKRVGPAEVEAIVCAHPEVTEAAAIGVPHTQKGTALVVVCVGTERAGLAAELRSYVGQQLGKPLQPERVCFVSALPKTRNGKTVRRVIRAAYLGEAPGDVSALENPAALEEIRMLN